MNKSTVAVVGVCAIFGFFIGTYLINTGQLQTLISTVTERLQNLVPWLKTQLSTILQNPLALITGALSVAGPLLLIGNMAYKKLKASTEQKLTATQAQLQQAVAEKQQMTTELQTEMNQLRKDNTVMVDYVKFQEQIGGIKTDVDTRLADQQRQFQERCNMLEQKIKQLETGKFEIGIDGQGRPYYKNLTKEDVIIP